MNCPKESSPDRISELGNTESYKSTTVLFYMVGVAFGAPYSMTQINVVDWIYSKWYFKLIRTAIAVGLSVGIFEAFKRMDRSEWYIKTGLPLCLVSFFFYGPYVVLLCKFNFLVSKFTGKIQSQKTMQLVKNSTQYRSLSKQNPTSRVDASELDSQKTGSFHENAKE